MSRDTGLGEKVFGGNVPTAALVAQDPRIDIHSLNNFGYRRRRFFSSLFITLKLRFE